MYLGTVVHVQMQWVKLQISYVIFCFSYLLHFFRLLNAQFNGQNYVQWLWYIPCHIPLFYRLAVFRCVFYGPTHVK